jgi:hypothetical protein
VISKGINDLNGGKGLLNFGAVGCLKEELDVGTGIDGEIDR